MIKLCWTGNGILALTLLGVISMIFISPGNEPLLKEEIDIKASQEGKTETKRTFESYKDIWDVETNVKSAPPPVNVEPPVDFHRQMLQRHIKIAHIISDGYAWAKVNNVDRFLEKMTEMNKNDIKKNWLIEAGGHQLIVLEIVPGKGIKFRFKTSGKEIWLEDNAPADSKTGQKRPEKAEKERIATRMIGPNHMLVSAEEGERLLQDADRHIEQLAPAVEYDASRNPVGVKLRRVLPNTKAHEYGLRENDVITNLNGSSINSMDPAFVRGLIDRHSRDRQVVVEIMRGGQKVRLIFDVRR